MVLLLRQPKLKLVGWAGPGLRQLLRVDGWRGRVTVDIA